MSEDTTKTAAEAASSERAGYCQDCGKPLTRDTVRVVGTGVFCEPCLATRIGATPVGYATAPGSPAEPGAAYAQPGPSAAGATQPGSNQSGSNSRSENPWSAAWYGSGAAMPGGAGSGGTNPGGPAPGGSAPGSSAPGGSAPGGTGFTPAPPTHLPNPTLAALLGIIPGVGAMYNGQLVKGLMHLAVFGVLVVFQNNVSGVFGIFVAGWILYQIFDAYHTARARRFGTPLPNLFGINDLADRIATGQGFGAPPGGPVGGASTQAGSYGAPPPPPAGAGWEPQQTGAAPPPIPPAPPAYNSYGVPPANWAGYAHPATFAAPSPPPPSGYAGSPAPGVNGFAEQPRTDAGTDGTPYAETFAASGVPTAGSPLTPMAFAPAPKRFPVGALWLIAFGVLVLVGNLSSEWRISGLWVLAGLFAALAVWALSRRLEWAGGYSAVMDGQFPRLAGMLRAPIMLMTLSVLFFLQAAHIATFGQTWPIFPIAFGVALFLERTIGASTTAPLPPAGSYYGVHANPGAPTSVTPPDSRDVQS